MGLVLPWQVPVPHFVCEMCQVRGQLGRELAYSTRDRWLLCLERMRQIDYLSAWRSKTLAQYGGKLRYVETFERTFQVEILRASPLAQQVNSLRPYR
jgi:hypothetical protein